MATGPLDAARAESLRAERDALAARCTHAEAEVARLSGELAAARDRLAELEAAAAPISLFEGGPVPAEDTALARDGSDPRVLSLALAATAVVSGMVALLALVNGNLGSTLGVAMVLVTLGLAFASARTRVRPVEVSVVRGVVHIRRGESTYRFDLRSDATHVETEGRPGDAFWQARFHRKGMEPIVVDTDMVDPDDFVRRLREHRPEL